MNLKDIRIDYTKHDLSEESIKANALDQFKVWLQEALEAQVSEPTAMTLSTASLEGKPSARIVLLKGVEEDGFVFFTNYESKKGQELAINPQACLTFHWIELERQVRVEGIVEKISGEASTAYFLSRPKGSQIGAIASPQSSIIPNREFLEKKVAAVETEQGNKEQLEKPSYWGGYVLKPTYIEFWQGRASRLHDRIVFELVDGQWQTLRLAP